MNNKIQEIIDWLKDFNERTNSDGYVIGLSGGVDSALVAAMCERATPGKTLAIVMPCYSDPKDAKDAYLVSENIGLKTIEVNLDNSFDVLYNELTAHTSKEDRGAKANIKPRLRMITLYFYANIYNKLVIGTTNRDETYVGYSTKWGDGAADVMPITHLSKNEVYDFSRELGIPESIISKTPTAGLWLNQTDEQEMGFSYKVLDDYLNGREVPEDARKRIEILHKSSRHKYALPTTFKGDR